MTITTEDCKQAIKKWAQCQDAEYAEVSWKRSSKSKDSLGRWVRMFTDPEMEVDPIFVTETDQGLQVGFDPMDEQWYFQAMPFDDNYATTCVEIVSKSFFDRHHHLDSNHIEYRIAHILPEGFGEDCESMFTTDLSLEDARQRLIQAGFIEKKFDWNEE